ncbi:hypothetical protein Cni_G09850 [Canna indica]|uniref:FAF domain-containing protein n=1 Tax=Canna indica TaxID=4628 RepID=A0AAQ3K8U7_9LILI|nr:hypothetical protein Cni_G09850 [Canna indica]
MSVAVLRSSSADAFHLDKCSSLPAPVQCFSGEDESPLAPPLAVVEESSDEERPGQFDIWSAIQLQKKTAEQPAAPYVHPLVRRSSSLLSQKSLEICTESLGSETGSDDFSSFVDDLSRGEEEKIDVREKQVAVEAEVRAAGMRRRLHGAKLMSVNYHRSNRRRSPPSSFPPPLPSISQRNVPCLHMRPHRVDGRLVMEAVAVPSKNYLHAQRFDGRLLLSFTNTTAGDEPRHESSAFESAAEIALPQLKEEHADEGNEILESTQVHEKEEELEEQNDEEDEEEEEEEVEVVDRGTMVEVNVSTQPQQQSGAMKVHRSSLFINKFVGGTPDENSRNKGESNKTISSATTAPRRALPTTTTAAAAVATLSATTTEGYYNENSHGGLRAPVGDQLPPLDNKLLFTSKRRNRDEMLHSMRRCSQLRCRPLFIWEPCFIATSS